MNTAIVTIVAITAITIIEVVALKLGTDGVLLAGVIAAIAGLGGFTTGQKVSFNSRKKQPKRKKKQG